MATLLSSIPDAALSRRRAALLGGALALVMFGLSCSEHPAAPRVPTQLVLTTNAAGARSGAAFTTQPVVAVGDAAGKTVTGNTSTVTMTVSGSGTVVGSATATAVDGVATFTNVGISGAAPASYTLTFSASGLTSATQSITLVLAIVGTYDFAARLDSVWWETGAAISTPPDCLGPGYCTHKRAFSGGSLSGTMEVDNSTVDILPGYLPPGLLASVTLQGTFCDSFDMESPVGCTHVRDVPLFQKRGSVYSYSSSPNALFANFPHVDPDSRGYITLSVTSAGDSLYGRMRWTLTQGRSPDAHEGMYVARRRGSFPPRVFSSIAVSPSTGLISVGQTLLLTGLTVDASGFPVTGHTVTWSSSNPSVATVNSATGLATAVATGTATITATSEGKTGAAVLLTVTPLPLGFTITVSPSTVSALVGQTQQFFATLRDASGNILRGRTVAWSSSNAGIAMVDSVTGLATTVAAGTATIAGSRGGTTATATLTVIGSGPSCSSTSQLGCGLALDQFTLIPAGTFQMGSAVAYPFPQPVHAVTITRDFYMQKTEVTQAQWRAVMGSNPSAYSSCGDTCPVDQVSWDDIQLFIQQVKASTGVTYRLPTEAEWEYAARAGTTGDTYGALDDIAWHGGNADGRPHPVAGKLPNAWGLYDMLGNVWEWVNDWYGPYSGAAETDPTGPASGNWRVMRGGMWTAVSSPTAADRLSNLPSLRSWGIGFRLVRTP